MRLFKTLLLISAIIFTTDLVGQDVPEYQVEYNELIKSQGEHAYAFDFFTTSMLWTCIATAMVFIMHLGFSTLEVGLCRSKNTVNILFKNVFIICIGLLTYALFGFNTHYPGEFNGLFSLGGPIGDLNLDGGDTFGYGGISLAMTGFGDFIFQAMFAATAATIVSGAVAERINLKGFLILATLLVGIAYPIAGSWHWGGGWLSQLGGGDKSFYDFAGSTVVHAFGGFAALASVLVLGPRTGKYIDGKIKPIVGHNMTFATIGVFLLFFGWFGFNGGSVLSANPGPLGLVFTTTALAAAAGGIGSIVTAWIHLKKPDLSMSLNGILAGLVGITAGADSVSVISSIIIGLISGIIVVYSILAFDKLKIDDPVGAISVHGVCGIWGTIAVALFGDVNLTSQLIGITSVCIFAFTFSYVISLILNKLGMLRVNVDEEDVGLDISEHHQEAYIYYSK